MLFYIVIIWSASKLSININITKRGGLLFVVSLSISKTNKKFFLQSCFFLCYAILRSKHCLINLSLSLFLLVIFCVNNKLEFFSIFLRRLIGTIFVVTTFENSIFSSTFLNALIKCKRKLSSLLLLFLFLSEGLTKTFPSHSK